MPPSDCVNAYHVDNGVSRDGKALAAALYTAGRRPNGRFSVEVMLDRLVSHPLHIVVMQDIDKKFDTPDGRQLPRRSHPSNDRSQSGLQTVGRET